MAKMRNCVFALMVLALSVLPAHGLYVFLSGKKGRWPWLLAAVMGSIPAIMIIIVASSIGQTWAWIKLPTTAQLLELPRIVTGGLALGWFLFGVAFATLRQERPAWLGLVLGWLLLPPLALALASFLYQPMWVERYFYFTMPALALLAAASLVRFRMVVPGLILVVLLGLPMTMDLRATPSRWEDYRSAAGFISDNLEAGDALIYSRGDTRLGLDYYLRDKPQPADILLLKTPAEAGELTPVERPIDASLLEGHDRVWRVVKGADGTADAHLAALEGFREVDTYAYPGLVITLFERRGG